MMVVDANILASLVLPTESAEFAEALYHLDPEWIAPSVITSELMSVLVKSVRARTLTLDDAVRSLQLALDMLSEHRVAPDPALVMRLAEQTGCSTYDCEYVAVAEMCDCTLVTYDARVRRAFPGRAMHPERLLEG